jgi:hypothetical protein
MYVEDEIDERVGVVHPAEVEDHRCMKVAQTILRASLDDGRDEDGEGSHQDGCRLSLDRLKLLSVYPPVYERIERGHKAENVLGIDRCADADAGDVRICRNGAHGACRRRGSRRKEQLRLVLVASYTYAEHRLFVTACHRPTVDRSHGSGPSRQTMVYKTADEVFCIAVNATESLYVKFIGNACKTAEASCPAFECLSLEVGFHLSHSSYITQSVLRRLIILDHESIDDSIVYLCVSF